MKLEGSHSIGPAGSMAARTLASLQVIRPSGVRIIQVSLDISGQRRRHEPHFTYGAAVGAQLLKV